MAKHAEKIQQIESTLRDIEEQLKNPVVILAAINKVEKVLEEMKRQVKDTQNVLAEITAKQISCEKENRSLKADNLKIKQEISELREFVEVQEREKRLTWIELTGVKIDQGISKDEVIKKIHQACNLKFKQEDIVDSYIKDAKNQNSKIVVKYRSQEIKEEVQRAVRNRKLKTDDIGEQGTRSIFANDCLSVYAGSLFWQVRKAKFEKKWRAAWTTRGKIYVRLEENGNAIQIRNETDLLTLLK